LRPRAEAAERRLERTRLESRRSNDHRTTWSLMVAWLWRNRRLEEWINCRPVSTIEWKSRISRAKRDYLKDVERGVAVPERKFRT
jgi:hypothetical protein